MGVLWGFASLRSSPASSAPESSTNGPLKGWLALHLSDGEDPTGMLAGFPCQARLDGVC